MWVISEAHTCSEGAIKVYKEQGRQGEGRPLRSTTAPATGLNRATARPEAPMA